jgi:hypothetical protein
MFKKLFGAKNSPGVARPADRKEPMPGPPGPGGAQSTAAPSHPDRGTLAIQAGEIIGKFMMAGYQDERGIHLESILSATAALAGYSAQQAALAMIKDGTPEARQFPQLHEITTKSGQVFLVSELANQFVASGGGPERLTVLALVADAAFKAGAKRVPDMMGIMERNAKFFGSDNYPPLTVPPQHFPRENAFVALQRWWPVVVKVFSVDGLHDLHPLYHMFALSGEVGRLIELGKETLNPEIAMLLAMETAVAMSKVTGIRTELAKST